MTEPDVADPRDEDLRPVHRNALAVARDTWREVEEAGGGSNLRARPLDPWHVGDSADWDRAGIGRAGTRSCGVFVTRGAMRGNPCLNRAGLKTDHEGWGPCWAHAGRKLRGRAEAGWLAAHAFAREMDISPWDALLKAVRIAAGRVAYAELVLGQATSDLEIEGRVVRGEDGILVDPDTGDPLGVGKLRDLTFWRQQSELWTDRMARYSKMAVDSGIAAALVQRVELEAQGIAAVLNAVIEGIQDTADEATVARARSIAREQLLRLDEDRRSLHARTDADVGVVDSTWRDGG